MGAVLSLIRNGLLGLGLFAGGTAAVAIALSFAIAGPPTDEEMSALSTFTEDAMREGGALAERAAASFCAEVDICESPSQLAEAPVARADLAPPLPEPEPLPEPATEIIVAAPLLGGHDDAPRIEARRQRAEARAERPQPRRARDLRARAERARPAPLETPRQAAVERLAEREIPDIQDVPTAYQADFGPNDQQQIAQESHDEAYYDGRYADDEGSYDGWEDDWRAERRARREERRRREEQYEEYLSEEAPPPEEYWPAY
jgi:hypothetical protein